MGNCHVKVKKSAVEGKKKKRDSGLFIMEDGRGRRKGKRNSIVTRTFDECDDESELRTDKITAFLKRSLLSNATFAQEMILRHITPEDMTRIVAATQVVFFEPGERLFVKHDIPCDNLYIVRRGIFRGLEDETTKIIFREGDVMGETGYFQDCSQISTVVAEGDEASAYCLTKRDFRLIAEKGRDLNNIKLLNGLSQDQKYMLKDTMGVTNYARGRYVAHTSEHCSSFLPSCYSVHRSNCYIRSKLISHLTDTDDEPFRSSAQATLSSLREP
jgi:Cyclic nucleotide-binding domain